MPTGEAKERSTMALSHALDLALATLFATSVGYMIPFIHSQMLTILIAWSRQASAQKNTRDSGGSNIDEESHKIT